MKHAPILLVIVAGIVALAALVPRHQEIPMPEHFPVLDADEIGDYSAVAGPEETATFGSGCFWCTEAVFQRLKGVNTVVSGYCGGWVPNPSYHQICTGQTGHAEVVQITFDPRIITYPELLEVFWRSHDPTTINRQGNDTGPQYRSVIFYHSEHQRKLAELYKKKIDEAGVFNSPVVTAIEPAGEFFPAELEHQNFYTNNPQQGYCRVVITPKLDKFRAVFQDKLR